MLDYPFLSACGPVLNSSGMLFSNPGSRAYFASRRLGHRSHQSGAMQKMCYRRKITQIHAAVKMRLLQCSGGAAPMSGC